MKRRLVSPSVAAMGLLGLLGATPAELALRTGPRGRRAPDDEGLRPGAMASSGDAEERRVVVLGDSIPYGYELVADQAYPCLLERLLKQSAPELPVRVINAGICGNTVLQGRERLGRHALAHGPDLIIVGFGLNDQHLHRSALDIRREWAFRIERCASGRIVDALRRSRLVRVLGAILGKLALLGLSWLVPTHLEDPRVSPRPYREGFSSLIDAIPAETPILLLTMTPADWGPFGEEHPHLLSLQRKAYGRYDAILRSLPLPSRATLVDLAGTFGRPPDVDCFHADGVHLSPQGQRTLAQALLDPTLGALGLL